MSDETPQINALLQYAILSARHELAKAIGHFSIEFADMENKLNLLIHELLGLEPDTGHALTSAIISVSTRLEILDTLGRELESAKPYRQTIKIAHKDAKELNGYRNWLLHDHWSGSMSRDGGEWTHQKKRMRPSGKGRQWQHGSFTEKEIMSKAGNCMAVGRFIQPILSELSRARIEREKKAEWPH